MTLARLFDWFQLGALGCLGVLALRGALAQRARGVRLFAIDRQRSLAAALRDLLFVLCFLVWIYEVAAYAWPLRAHLVPAALGTVLVDAVAVRLLGVAVTTAGVVIYGLALRDFGDSWRLGIDRDTPGALVCDGIFGWTRNPVYLGLELLIGGSFLLQGRLIFLLLTVAAVVLLHDLIRREEQFLLEVQGEAYRDYCARVGRYVRWW